MMVAVIIIMIVIMIVMMIVIMIVIMIVMMSMLITMIPIEVTLVGIVTDVSDVQFWKARVPNDRVRVSLINAC